MTRGRLALAAITFFALVACALAGVGGSGATFTDHNENLANTFSTGDWVAPTVTLTAPADGSRVGTATPTLTGAAGTVSGDLPSIDVRIYSGSGTSGPLAASGTATASGGAWSLPAPVALADGTYTAQASQSDSAGNTGTSSAVTFTVDTTAPAPTVTAPAAYVNTTTPAISGTAGNAIGDSTSIAVTIKQGATTVQSLTATRTGTAWSVTPSTPLAAGTYTVTATQADDLGNSGTSASRTFTVDQTAPAVTLTAPASGASFQTRTPSISGTAGSAAGDLTAITVKVYAGAGTGGSVAQTLTPTAAGGSWSATAASLADGVYTVQATQADQAGNTGTSAAVTFSVDNTAPAVTLTAPSGYVATATPTISGTAGAAAGDNTAVTVEILSGASVVRTLSATRTGTTWSVAAAPALSDGAYTARVTQADAAGNSATSATSAFTVDTTAPAVTVSAPLNGAATNATTPALSGTAGNAAGDSSTVTVRLYSGAGTGGTLLQTLTPTRAGTAWSATATALGDGTYTVAATQTDAAGNTSAPATSTFSVDTVAPSPAVSSPTGYVLTSGPTIAGTAGTATGDSSTVRVEVLSGTTVVWSNNAVAVSGGAWSVAASGLADGAYTARVTQSDWAGNSSMSSSVAFTVDTTTPAPTITAPTGVWQTTSTPAISGAAGNAAGDAATVTLRIYNGSGTGGSVAQTLTPTRSGATWSATPATLGDGTYTLQATQTDAAGHSGTSNAVTFTVDTAAPAPTITAPTGYVLTATPTLSGTAGNAANDAASVTVEILSGASVVQTLTPTRSGTSWSVAAATLSDGAYTARVTQTDAAGNSGTSSTVSFSVDTTTPAPTVTAPAAGYVNTATPALSGAAGNATGDSTTVTVVVKQGATTVQTLSPTRSGASWSATPTTLADGTYTVTATQTDAAGHSGTSAAVTFTVDTVAPVPTITAPTGYVTTATPALSGAAGNATGDNATVTVQILSGASVVQTLTPTRTGASWSATAATLADGAYTAKVTQADAAGNSTTSSSVSFTVDTTTPAPAITAPAANASINNAAPTIGGTAGTAAGDATSVTVRVYNGTGTGGTLNQTKTASVSGGSWSTTATGLSDGTYTAQATQTDAAGHTGTSSAVTFTVDTTIPAVPVLTGPTGTLNTATPTLTGTVVSVTGDASNVIVDILSGTTVVRTFTVPVTGGTFSGAVPTALPDGAYTARARRTDAAGNTSANSLPVAFTVDTTAPAVTLTAPATNSYTNNNAPTFTGAAGTASGDAATVTVRIYNAGGTLVQTRTAVPVAGTWSVAASPALAQGTYTVQATQLDAAGNTGTSTTNTFTVDTTRPTATGVSASGGTVGLIEPGDVMTFTYSEAIDPASVTAGFTGAAMNVVVRVQNAGNKDVLTLLTTGGTAINVATQIKLSANFVSATTTWASTMTQSADGRSIIVTLGTPTPASGTTKLVTPAKNMAWSFNNAVTDLAGNAINAGTYTENVADTDF